jgi:hypothetical protein
MNDCNPKNAPRDMQAHTVSIHLIDDDKFELGHIHSTPGVQALVQAGHFNPALYLRRHASGDWGDLCESDKSLNNLALGEHGECGRIFSVYQITATLKIYVITEWDRSVTTLLLPSEY